MKYIIEMQPCFQFTKLKYNVIIIMVFHIILGKYHHTISQKLTNINKIPLVFSYENSFIVDL